MSQRPATVGEPPAAPACACLSPPERTNAALAGGALLLSFAAPDAITGPAALALALPALLLALLPFLRSPRELLKLVSAAPAPLLALLLVLLQPGSGPRLLLAAVLSFQLRSWLLSLSLLHRRKREQLSQALLARNPGQAIVFVDSDIESVVPLSSLQEGHVVRVGPGEWFPGDGVVSFGSGFVDDSLTEGEEPRLRLVAPGTAVFSGTRNQNSQLLVKLGSTGGQCFRDRLAARLARGAEIRPLLALSADSGITALAGAAFLLSGPEAALRALLVGSGAAAIACLSLFELALAERSLARGWIWRAGAVRRIARAGTVVTEASGVVSEGRARLTAIEVVSGCGLSEDSVLGLMGPIARKLESPAAFALLLELRARNIPLEQTEFFHQEEEGALAQVAGDELRWTQLGPRQSGLELGPLDAFAREHLMAGEELHLLERNGILCAALAFRDPILPEAAAAAEALRESGLPVVLVSPLPRPAVARLQTELNLEHAQGESRPEDTERLMEKLAQARLRPVWVQSSGRAPRHRAASIAWDCSAPDAELSVMSLRLPALAEALLFARHAWNSLLGALALLFGAQIAMLALLLSADPRWAAFLRLGQGWHPHETMLVLLGAAPALAGLLLTGKLRYAPV